MRKTIISIMTMLLLSGGMYASADSDLMDAVLYNSMAKVKRAIRKGAKVNQPPSGGRTPLTFAIYKKNKQMVKYLIARGADVNYKMKDGITPIFYVIERMKLDMVKYFVGKGAKLSVKTTKGYTPLIVAVQKSKFDIAKYLLKKGADANGIVDSYNGDSLLHWAVKRNKLDFLEAFVKNGAKLDVKDDQGNTPLYHATVKTNFKMAKYLISKGADVNAKDKRGDVVLKIISQKGYYDMAKLFVENGADISVRDRYFDLPLHTAISYGRFEIAKYLINKGTSINVTNKRGMIPLLYAAENKRLNIVQWLVSNSIYVYKKDRWGREALTLTKRRRYDKDNAVTTFLKTLYTKPNRPPKIDISAVPSLGADNVIKGCESGEVVITVINRGKADGNMLTFEITPISNTSGVTISNCEMFLSHANSTNTIKLPVITGNDVASGEAVFEIVLKEPFYKKDFKTTVKIFTRGLEKPVLGVDSGIIDDDKDGDSDGNANKIAEAGEDIELVITLTNKGLGTAKDVKATPMIKDNPAISIFGDLKVFSVGDINPGESKTIKIPVSIGSELTSTNGVEVSISITEARKMGEAEEKVTFSIGGENTEVKITVLTPEEADESKKEVLEPKINYEK